jgi:phage repressor protein C with HTH and peptisase S24 domain
MNTTRLENLERLIEKRFKGKDADFARKANVSASQISQWRAGYRSLGEKVARGIEEALNLPVGYLDREQGVLHLVSDGGDAGHIHEALDVSPGYGSHQVPLLKNSASMGGGQEALHEDVFAGSLALSQMFIQNQIKPTTTNALRFIHAYGDSMKPTFESGDILLVDTGIKEVKIDGVYVLEAHDRLFVKRVRQKLDGFFEISSDNPTHKTVDTLNGNEGVRVVGRVVWVWNGKKL